MSEQVHEWDRLAAESVQAFAAFTVYKDLGPGRSLTKVAAALGDRKRAPGGPRKGPERAPKTGRISVWSRTHRWPERAAAWDAHVARAKQDAAVSAAKDSGREWSRRYDGQLEASLGHGDLVLKQGVALASFPAFTKSVYTEQSGDGKRVVHHTTYAAADPRTLLAGSRMIQVGLDIIWETIDRGLRWTGADGTPGGAEPQADVDEVIMLTRKKLAEFHEEQRKLLEAFPKSPPLE